MCNQVHTVCELSGKYDRKGCYYETAKTENMRNLEFDIDSMLLAAIKC